MKNICVMLLIILSLTSHAQYHDLHFEHLTSENGLPETKITALKQDKLGYIWIGTQNGLVRYDGYQLKVYKLGSEKKDNSKYFMPTDLLEDKNGVLWIATVHDGIFRYNRESDNFTQYESDNMMKNEGTSHRIVEMVEDNQDNLWMRYRINPNDLDKTDHYGLERFNPKTLTFTKFPYLTNSFVKSNDGGLWFGTTTGLVYYDYLRGKMGAPISPDPGLLKQFLIFNLYEAVSEPGVLWFNVKDAGYKSLGFFSYDTRNKLFKQYLHDPFNPGSIATDSVDAIHEDKQQRLWIATWRGMSLLDRKTGRFKNYTPADTQRTTADDYSTYVYKIKEGTDGKLWFNSNNGLLAFNTNTGAFNRYTTDEKKPNSLAVNSINKLIVDRTGLLWAGLDYGGLDHVNGFRSQFDVYPFDESLKYSCSQSYGYGIVPAGDGYFWLGSAKGLVKWKPNTAVFANVKLPRSIKPGWLNVLLLSHDGLLWCTTANFNPFVYDLKTGAIDTFKNHPNWLNKQMEFNHIYEDHTGTTWLGTVNDGLFSYDKNTRSFTRYPYEPLVLGSTYGGKKLDNKQVRSIYEDKQGTLWVGTNIGGLNRFNRKEGTFTSYYDLRKGLYSIQRIYEDKEGRFWLGTYLSGLFLFDRKTGNSRSFTESDGLLYNEILGIMEDHSGNLWLNCERGLSVMNPETHAFNNYTTENALPFDCLGYFNKTPENQFIYANPNGLLAFYPDKLQKNPYPPQINIEVLGHNDPQTKKDTVTRVILYDKKQVELPHNQNRISFNYVALHYENPAKNQYAYQLEGYDQNWVKAGTQRSVTYTNLPPGSYTFKVKGSNSDGIWSQQAASIILIIYPPWWLTWWAYLLYFILFAAAIYAFVIYRTRKLTHDKRALELQISIRTEEVLQQKEEIEAQRDKLEMEKIRSDIAADFHDELGSTLSSIALYSEMAITDNFKDERRTKSILSLISEASIGTVSAMQDMIWAIQPKNDKMQEVIYRMREYAYPLAELKNIGLTFNIGEDVQEMILSMDIRKNTYLIFKEALNNAFKYASASHIIVNMDKRKNLLYMEIKDDGKGFDMFDRKAGNGLTNMHKRAEQAGGALAIKSGKGKGTEILFSCPVN